MILRKWNYQTRTYEPFKVPDAWNVTFYSNDMDEIVNCPQCGRELKYGDTYISLEVHSPTGFGYGVCRACYDAENRRKYE